MAKRDIFAQHANTPMTETEKRRQETDRIIREAGIRDMANKEKCDPFALLREPPKPA